MVFTGLSPRSAQRGSEAGVTQGCLREDPHVGGEGGGGREGGPGSTAPQQGLWGPPCPCLKSTISFFRRTVSFLAPCFKAGGPGLAGVHSEHHFVCSGQAENPCSVEPHITHLLTAFSIQRW